MAASATSTHFQGDALASEPRREDSRSLSTKLRDFATLLKAKTMLKGKCSADGGADVPQAFDTLAHSGAKAPRAEHRTRTSPARVPRRSKTGELRFDSESDEDGDVGLVLRRSKLGKTVCVSIIDRPAEQRSSTGAVSSRSTPHISEGADPGLPRAKHRLGNLGAITSTWSKRCEATREAADSDGDDDAGLVLKRSRLGRKTVCVSISDQPGERRALNKAVTSPSIVDSLPNMANQPRQSIAQEVQRAALSLHKVSSALGDSESLPGVRKPGTCQGTATSSSLLRNEAIEEEQTADSVVSIFPEDLELCSTHGGKTSGDGGRRAVAWEQSSTSLVP